MNRRHSLNSDCFILSRERANIECKEIGEEREMSGVGDLKYVSSIAEGRALGRALGGDL